MKSLFETQSLYLSKIGIKKDKLYKINMINIKKLKERKIKKIKKNNKKTMKKVTTNKTVNIRFDKSS